MIRLMAPAWFVHDAAKLGMAVGKFGLERKSFYYPVEKRCSARTIAEMCMAKKHLDRFWETVDQHFFQHTGMTLHEQLKSIVEVRDLSRTKEWIEPPEQVVASEESLTDETTPSSILATLVERTESTLTKDEIPPIKEKAKTRGEATTAPPPDEGSSGKNTANEPIPSKTFKVSKRGSRVFSMLFHSPYEEGVPGELPWIDFLHALASIGFAVQKLDGSAWLFSPAVPGVMDQSIIFHEPHPKSKISFQIARRYGGRLTRAFGWTAGNFVRE